MPKKIIVISAMWCPSCLILKKNLKQLKEDNNIDIDYLDYDFDEEEVKKHNVGDILPVMIIKENDKEINRLIGEKSYEEILDFLKGNDCLWKRDY